MKAPEVNKAEGRRIDEHFDCGKAKEIVECLLGGHPTLKEIFEKKSK